MRRLRRAVEEAGAKPPPSVPMTTEACTRCKGEGFVPCNCPSGSFSGFCPGCGEPLNGYRGGGGGRKACPACTPPFVDRQVGEDLARAHRCLDGGDGHEAAFNFWRADDRAGSDQLTSPSVREHARAEYLKHCYPPLEPNGSAVLRAEFEPVKGKPSGACQ